MAKNKDKPQDESVKEKRAESNKFKCETEAEVVENILDEEVEISEIDRMREDLEKAQNYVLRTKADMENIKKRNINLASEMFIEGKMETLLKIIPVIDSFDRAISMETAEKEGMIAIKKQFDNILERLGVEEIKSLGEVFDPHLHNALLQVDDESNSGKIVQVYEKGYRLADKILRHSSVVVAK